MPRAAKLRRKDGYWFTQAGSKSGAYFGRTDQVSYDEAKRKFGEFLASLRYEREQRQLPTRSVAEICNQHLAYVKNNALMPSTNNESACSTNFATTIPISFATSN